MTLLLCAGVVPHRTKLLNIAQAPVKQVQPKSLIFSGKIVSQNGVRFVLRDDGNNVWYHLDDQEKAGKLVGKDVVVTGSVDGLTGTIRVQSIVEGTLPPPSPAANTEEKKQDSEPAKSTATPPVSADAVAPSLVNSSEAEIVAQKAHCCRRTGWVLVGAPPTVCKSSFLTSRIVFRDSSAWPFREYVVKQCRRTTRSRKARRLGRNLEKASRWPGECGYNELSGESVRRS